MNTAQSNKKLLSLLTAAGLVLTLLCVVLPYTAFADPDSWVNEIDQMLAAGDYLEGEVLVGIVEPEKSDTLSAQASSLLDRAEPLMETTVSSLNESESALTAQGDKPMTVSFISSNEMTTEELLHALADDPRVVFAEPNYRTKLTDEDIEDALASAEDPNSDDVSADVTPDDDTPVPSDDSISDDSSSDDSSTDDTSSDDDVLVPTEDPTDDTPKDVIPADDKPSDDKPSDDKADDKPSDDKKDDEKDDKADDKTDDKDVPAADEEIIVIPVDNDDKSDGSNSGNSGQNSGQNASDSANTTPSTTVPTATVNYTRPTGTLPSVRPNLVTSAPQGDGVQLTAAASTGIADLTGFQWANSNKTSVRVDELGGKNPTGAINVKDFGPTGSNMKNTVVVAVLDNLVDYRLADLSGQVYQFSAEQQKSLGCYQWGYNAVNGGGQQASDFKIDDHATHCAGIIASAWDGEGTSGIASRARIMSIQVAGPKSEQITSDAFVRACAFIDKYNASCAENNKQNEQVRVMSNSFGLSLSTRALSASITELGRKYGVVNVFSAGNSHVNNDSSLSSASTLRQNPYVITVAATDIADQLAVFSNYGALTVDLAAPGTGILSTVTLESAAYLPDALSAQQNFFYEGFEGAQPAVAIDQVNTALTETKSPVCTITSGNEGHLSGEHALRFYPVDSSLTADDGKTGIFVLSVNCTEKLPENTQMSFAYSRKGSYVECAQATDITGRNLKITRNNSTVTAGWGVVSVAVDDLCVKNGRLQIVVVLKGDMLLDSILFDSVGVGNLDVPYAFFDGTSMACPVVAGGTAVLASEYPDDSGADLAARVRASVRENESLKGKTVTGGVLDLSKAEGKDGKNTDPVDARYPLYETTLPLDTDTGEPYDDHDGKGDIEVAGQLLVLNDTLWYLTSDVYSNEQQQTLFVNQEMRAFNPKSKPKTWEEDRSFYFSPAVSYYSACVYDGKIWILGDIYDPTGSSDGFEHGTTVLLSCVPSTKRVTVYKLDTGSFGNTYRSQLFATPDGGLRVYDEYAHDTDEDGEVTKSYMGIKDIDPEKGTVSKEVVVECPGFSNNVSIATHENTAYLMDWEESKLYKLEDNELEEMKVEIPQYLDERQSWDKDSKDSSGIDWGNVMRGSLVAGDNALYIVGLTDKDNTADTWILPYNSTKLQAYGKRISSTRALQTTAAFYDDSLYALAAAWGEDNSCVFRSTLIGSSTDPDTSKDTIPSGSGESDNNKGGSNTNNDKSNDTKSTAAAALPKTDDITNVVLISEIFGIGAFTVAAVVLRKLRTE